MTPKFRINPQTGKVMMNKDDIDYYKQTRTIDPFPEVVKNIVTHNPNLEQDIKS